MTCSPQLYVCLLDTIAGLFSRQSDGAIGAASRCFVQAPFLESSESSSFSHLELLSSRRKIRCDCMRLRLLPRFDRRCFDPNPKLQFRPTPNTFTLWHECDSDEKTELPLLDENCFNCPFLHLGPSEAVPKQLAHLCLSAKLSAR